MINWEKICNRIDHWNTTTCDGFGYAESNPTEAIEVAANGGTLPDLDIMVYLKDLIGFPITYDLYSYINRHYDGSLMEIDNGDLPQLEWLIEDYVTNGRSEDIWKGYDYKKYQDEYGFCGWHKRVMDGIKESD